MKVITRLGQFTQFSETWLANITPMALRVLEKYIEKSIRYHINFNRERDAFKFLMDLMSIQLIWGVGHVMVDHECSREYHVHVSLLVFFTKNENQLTLLMIAIVRRLI